MVALCSSPGHSVMNVSECASSAVLPVYAAKAATAASPSPPKSSPPKSQPSPSPQPYCTPVSAVLQYHFSRRSAIVEKREHMFLRAMSKAMRYYRIWIYSANVALFLGTLVYTIAFLSVIGDERLSFFPAIRLYQPSFIYSYCAILVQGGLLQALGCIGALKLNERYLNLYLFTIIVLLFGDGALGIVWILRYNHIVTHLRTDLKLQIAKDYAANAELRDLWNDLQANSRCCGVDGPNDYTTSSWLNTTTAQREGAKVVLPPSCCLPEVVSANAPYSECITRIDEEGVFGRGCYDSIHHWLQHSVDLLSVLGFCVITFIKMCFLCLLRYEIKEMIEKIRVIKGQSAAEGAGTPSMMPFQDLEAYLPRPSMQQDTLLGVAGGGGGGPLSGTSGGSGLLARSAANSITEKCHCRLGVSMGTNLTSTFSGSRMILSTSTANLSGCQSKKHSLV